MLFNQRYGKFAFVLGVVFIAANILAGGLNFYLGSGGWNAVFDLKRDNILLWSLMFIPYYIATEFIPSITFAIVMQKYGEEMSR